jgi:hypothetical protein
MKKIFFFIGMVFLLIPVSLNAQDKKDNLKVVKDTIPTDSTQYELIIFDPGFDTYLLTKPMDMHSESFYETQNRFYVAEWNSRYMNPGRNTDLYESYIDYRPEIHYGLEFNYRLYYYFKYFEEVNGVDLIPGDRMK